MVVYMNRDDNNLRKDKLSPWLSEFADYWKDAQKRIKSGDYLSQIQRALRKERSVDDVVSELKQRVGLDIMEKIKKESEQEVEKKANFNSGILNDLKNDPEFKDLENRILTGSPKTFEAIWFEMGCPTKFENAEVKKYFRGLVKKRFDEMRKREDKSIGNQVESLDSSDNRAIFDSGDKSNTI